MDRKISSLLASFLFDDSFVLIIADLVLISFSFGLLRGVGREDFESVDFGVDLAESVFGKNFLGGFAFISFGVDIDDAKLLKGSVENPFCGLDLLGDRNPSASRNLNSIGLGFSIVYELERINFFCSMSLRGEFLAETGLK